MSSTLRRWRRIVAALKPYGRRHTTWLIRGSLAALLVIGARLALPWPIKAVLKPWLHSGDKHHAASADAPWWIPPGMNPALAMGGAFLALMLILGLADLLERLYFARFSIAAARDLRAVAFGAALRTQSRMSSSKPGDLIARLVGDMARMKGGLKSFLVHVATNGAMYVGVTVVLMWMDWRLGLVFAIAGLITASVTLLSAKRIFNDSRKYRKKEGKRAHKMHVAILAGPAEHKFAKIKSAKKKHGANVTRVQGLATWCTHAVFGAAVLASFWIGMRGVESGRVRVDHIVVFMIYALMMRGPLVRLTRQGARTGKILAGADRLVSLIRKSQESDHGEEMQSSLNPLSAGIHVADVTVKGSKSHGGKPRLGPIDLHFRCGERIAILGDAGSGKTTLLEALAGRQRIKAGQIIWDDRTYAQIGAAALDTQVLLAVQSPTWLRRSLRDLLDVPPEITDADLMDLLDQCGLDDLQAHLPTGLDSRIGSDDLSLNQRRLVNLARVARQPGSVLLVDDTFGDLNDDIVERLIPTVLNAQPRSLVVVAMSRPVRIDLFDRVIELSAGSVVFDGSSSQWRATQTTPQRGRTARQQSRQPEQPDEGAQR